MDTAVIMAAGGVFWKFAETTDGVIFLWRAVSVDGVIMCRGVEKCAG